MDAGEAACGLPISSLQALPMRHEGYAARKVLRPLAVAVHQNRCIASNFVRCEATRLGRAGRMPSEARPGPERQIGVALRLPICH